MSTEPSLELIDEPRPAGPEQPQVVKSKPPEFWDPDERYNPGPITKENVHTIPDLVELLRKDPNVEIEARVFAAKEGKAQRFTLNKKEFLESYDRPKSAHDFREFDYFATNDSPGGGASSIGKDYTPLLGGPFSKQLYYYDALEQWSQAFFAVNHDPILRNSVDLIINFVLGKGFRVDCENPDGLVLWRAFEKANKLQERMRYFLRELLVYGENMVWWLPDGMTEIRYMVPPEQAAQKGIIPRIRFIDPSTCWDYITMPEDIETKIAYVLVFPTQYQLYTGTLGGKQVPSTKFIYEQIPAHQIDHYKMNCMSNEKRGRSLLFPVLGYAKRLRDSVNYAIISLQKQGAWSIDTEIDGNQNDINTYSQQIQALGQFAPAGSEFIHSTKVKRTYLSNAAGGGRGGHDPFTWCLDMIAAGLGIPINYFGTSHSSGQSRAGSIVATEPVAKKMEEYQQYLENALHDFAERLFKTFGVDAEIEVTFPEVITQDRSAKLKDLATAESMGWISHSRAAEIAAKELNISKYDWSVEKEEIEQERVASDATNYMPLTMPAAMPLPGTAGTSQLAPPATGPAPGAGQNMAKTDSTSAVTSDEKRTIKNDLRR